MDDTEQKTPSGSEALDNDDVLIYDDMPMPEDGPAKNAASQTDGKLEPSASKQDAQANFSLPNIESLRDEPPVRLASEDKPPGSKWLWIPVILLLLLLPLQYAHFNAASLAEITIVKPYVEQFCSVTRCSLFNKDISLMEVSSLQVASHPEQQGALLIKGKISNKADFRQQLPSLVIQFESIQGEVMAARVFRPEEYLQGARLKQGVLSKRQRLLFQFELVDPGQAAQSYSFHLQ